MKHNNKGLWVLGLIAVLVGMGVFACSQTTLKYNYLQDKELSDYKAPDFPAVFFMSVSDTHYYDVSLGTNGEAFQNYLDNDRKLLAESGEILDVALDRIIKRKPEFLLISGDLTKDAEFVGHTYLANRLQLLRKAGIPVFVVPGNHDINNPDAVEFKGKDKNRVKTVTPDEFVEIYKDYGFSQAIARDTNSLSYVVEPKAGLWILALDSTIHEDNMKNDYPETDGAFKQGTVDWIETILMKALREKKAVIAMMHHGILEHWKGQEKLHGEYIVNEYEELSKMFAAYHVRLVFTGHYHALDIVKTAWDNKRFLFDIETGSLVTFPCPIREMTITADQKMTIRSHVITEIPSLGKDFVSHASNYVFNGVQGIAFKKILEYNAPTNEAKDIADQVAEAFTAHYSGRENKGDRIVPDKSRITSFMGGLVIGNQGYVIEGLWNDPEPNDDNIEIDLKNGDWKPIQ